MDSTQYIVPQAGPEGQGAQTTLSRQERMLQRGRAARDGEVDQVLEALVGRSDFLLPLKYFIDLFATGTTAEVIGERVQKPVAALLCLQAPLELFHAAGVHPHKIYSGSHSSSRIAAPHLPTLMCPMIRSVLGVLQLDEPDNSLGRHGEEKVSRPYAAWVLPTTCDWVTQFPTMMRNCGNRMEAPLHYLELPHLKSGERTRRRWLEEVYELKFFLERISGVKVSRKQLAASIDVFHVAWQTFVRLMEARRQGRLAAIWFTLITNSFFLDTPESWTQHVQAVLSCLQGDEARTDRAGEYEKAFVAQGHPKPLPRVMLAGSPVIFPNYKVLQLIEEARMFVAADDLCSSERLFPGGIFYSDTSEDGLLEALAQRYHQGCMCPTFAQNDRRFASILTAVEQENIGGVIFHVLKGCHPFELASFSLEHILRSKDVKYLKLETDYTGEDVGSLLTRLEAFRSSLSG